MSKPENYSEEEWATVSTLPNLVASAMAGVGASGVVGTTKEMFASMQTMIRAKKGYSQNSFIASLLPDTQNPKLAMEEAKQNREILMQRVKNANIQRREDLSDLVLEEVSKAMVIVSEKQSTEEAQNFKNWILTVAQDVAKAAKEGDFFGFGGERISEKEQQLLNQLNNQLA